MEGAGKPKQYRRAQKGNVKPYLDLMRIKRGLYSWLAVTPLAEVELKTQLCAYQVRETAEHLILSLTTREIKRILDVLEGAGEAAAIRVIYQLKGEEL